MVNKVKRRFSEIGLKAVERIIKSKQLTALPISLRSALVGHEDANVEQYAKIVDRMMAVAPYSSPFKTLNVVRQGDFNGRRDFNPMNNTTNKSFLTKTKNLQLANYFSEHAWSCRCWCKWPGRRPRMLVFNSYTKLSD